MRIILLQGLLVVLAQRCWGLPRWRKGESGSLNNLTEEVAQYDAGEIPRHTGRFLGEVVAPGQNGRYELLAPQNPLYETVLLPNAEVDVGMVLPVDFDTARSYPVMIFFGGGTGRRLNWEDWCARFIGISRTRGLANNWIVVSPIVAKRSQLDHVLPEFFEALRVRFNVEGDRFHIAGQSIGGGIAFRTALRFPAQSASLIVHTGVSESDDPDVLTNLKHQPVFMYVGDKDSPFKDRMKKTVRALQAAGHPPKHLDFAEFTDVGHLGILDALVAHPRLEEFWRTLNSYRQNKSTGYQAQEAQPVPSLEL